jgi:hypothetical protein
MLSDPHNCGGCGHDCLGGTCSSGACQPVAIGALSAQHNGKSIAVDAQNVYWTETGPGDGEAGSNGGVLKSCPKTGCRGDPTLLATNIGGADQIFYDEAVGNLFLASSGIDVVDGYTTTGKRIFRVQASAQVSRVAADASFLYWNVGNSIVRSTKDGLSQVTIADGLPSYVSALAVDPTSETIYAALQSPPDSGSIVQASTTASNPSSWSFFGPRPQPNPQDIAVGDGNVYWANLGTSANNLDGGGGIYTCPTTGCTQARVLATGSYGATVILDAAHVYFALNASIYRCSLGGCTGAPTLLSGGTAADLGGPSMAQDTTALYWVPATGRVMKLAK